MHWSENSPSTVSQQALLPMSYFWSSIAAAPWQVFIASGTGSQRCRLVSEPLQASCKRQKQDSRAAAASRRARSLSPYLRRVGGGYDYVYPQILFPEHMPQCCRTASTGRGVAAQEHAARAMHGSSSAAALLGQCHHEYDMHVLAVILQQAEADAAEEGHGMVRFCCL